MTNDVKGNLLKAKKILKKSLPSLAAARAAISKSDKSCLCNKNYVRKIKLPKLFQKLNISTIL